MPARLLPAWSSCSPNGISKRFVLTSNNVFETTAVWKFPLIWKYQYFQILTVHRKPFVLINADLQRTFRTIFLSLIGFANENGISVFFVALICYPSFCCSPFISIASHIAVTAFVWLSVSFSFASSAKNCIPSSFSCFLLYSVNFFASQSPTFQSR